jgi:hypothetical protein
MRWMLPVVAVTAMIGTMTASYASGTPGQNDGARASDKAADRIAVVGENERLLISPSESDRAGEYWNVDRMLKAKPMPLPDTADKGSK